MIIASTPFSFPIVLVITLKRQPFFPAFLVFLAYEKFSPFHPWQPPKAVTIKTFYHVRGASQLKIFAGKLNGPRNLCR